MEDNLNTLLQSQVCVEILNDKFPNKSLYMFEERLQKEILRLRNAREFAGGWELETFMDELATDCKFKTCRLHYQPITTTPDGHTLLVWEATLDKFHCFIYIRAL